MASKYLNEKADKYGAEQSRSRMPETPGDPLGAVENMLGGMWYGMRKLEEGVSNMYTSVLETTGLGNVLDTVNSWADTSRFLFSGADNILSNVGGRIGAGIMGAVNTVTTAVGNFLERTGNLFSGDGFNTSAEVAEIKVAQIKEQERIKEEQQQQEILKGNKPVGMSDAEYKQKFKELEQKFKEAEVKNVKDVDSSLKNLTDLAKQNGGGSEYVRKELKKALSKIPGGESLDVDKIIGTSCVSLSVWVALKQAGANVGEYGEFYEKQVKKGNITAENASVNRIIDVANSYAIDGKKPAIGFTRDFKEYDKLLTSGKVDNGIVFSKQLSGYHALNAYSSSEGAKISDVSYRTHGNFASEYVNNKNFRWLFYVQKRGK